MYIIVHFVTLVTVRLQTNYTLGVHKTNVKRTTLMIAGFLNNFRGARNHFQSDWP